jgi:diguanylate cyclase (GGDEF)-like protein
MILLDYNSLLLALSFCSAGVALTFFLNWLVFRTDRYLMIWALGAASLVVSIFSYSNFVENYSPITGMISFSALEIGLVLLLGAAHQFRTGAAPFRAMAILVVAANFITAVPMMLGFDGICYIVFNLLAMGILCATGLQYWRCRLEAPTLIGSLAVLYVVGGLSFGLCAMALVVDQKWIMKHAPDNWTEILNLIVCLIDTAAIGTLSLGLNQIRMTRRHKRDAEIDSLTGLFNRRAFFDQANGAQIGENIVVIVFDIDHFKQVNDSHGHQLGDTVLQTFASILGDAVRDGDVAARLGGEEFAVVLPDASLKTALLVAERVRKRFSERRFLSDGQLFGSTVSIGISKTGHPAALSDLMVQADAALYVAKRSGRDRVILFSNREDVRAQKAENERIELELAPKSSPEPLGQGVEIAARIAAQRSRRLTRRI